MKQVSAENSLARVKDEIRADAELAHRRAGELKTRRIARPSGPVQVPKALCGSCSIEELCQSHFTTFLDKAYQVLLRRKPDSAGYDAQLNLLASGRSKIEVLGNLRWSSEGRDIGVHVPWLLPRYLFAKLMRVPVLGYLIECAASLCALPRIVRHQRAADAYHSARRHDLRDQFRAITQQIGGILVELEKLNGRNSHLSANLDQLVDRVGSLQQDLELINSGSAELRHMVLSMNHWLASLRSNLSALESAEFEQERSTERLHADVALRMMDFDQHRSARQNIWAGRFVANLPASAHVLDLCSGEDWLKRLLVGGLEATAVAPNREMASRASGQERNFIVEAPATVLARAADHSLHGLTALDVGYLLRRIPAADLLSETQRVLRKKGWVLFGFSVGPATIADRLDGRPETMLDSVLMAQALLAAGFGEVEQIRSADGVSCVLARTEG